MMRTLVIALITFYQRYISPRKGFRCAHAALHHGDSCSGAVKRIIREEGVFRGYGKIRQRFRECKLAYAQISKEKERKRKESKYDGWDCGCDVLSCIPHKGCDLDMPCDCSP
jgi:putative component of membrane protein insertase Oxa1/YidC/SpoIIIJ protein YidD